MWKRFKGSKKNRPSSRLDEDVEPSNYSAASAKLDSFSFRSDPSDSSRPRDLEIRRKASEQSAISDIHGQLFPAPQHQRKRSEDRREDPLGLLVLHTPEPAEKRTVDILFVHGLGGTSLRTWCHGRDLDNLWPRLWLPDEDGFSSARILTYGYNAHFSSKKEQASLAIGDFANDLLFRMKYGESGPERLGQVPIVIVAHSMGGLVFKKAFIHGLLNDEFRDIISMIKSVLFLATPHRGTDLAETLNKILTSSIFGHSPKDYVSELARRSPTIDELNESFRHHASKLQIFSFYETLTTAIGPISAMILDKNTAVLGYPRETPQPLIANHHDVCKFKSTDDPNYLSVLGALRSVVGPTVPKYVSEIEGSSEEDLKLVKTLLGISAPPEEDLAAGRAVRKPGTCERFLASREFDEWRSSDSSRILWAHAPPGSGKSTICTLVIERLLESDEACAYFFFRYDNRQKQSIGYMLQSFAYQIAALEPEACYALAELAKAGERFQNADPVNIWKRLYLPILSNIHSRKTFYWVLDGIDESESSRQVVDFLSSINEFQSTIKILLFSRPHFTISQAMQKATTKTHVVELPLGDNKEDIRLTVAEEIIYLASDDSFKHDTVNKITSRSQGNFLWASLVVKLVASCHRQDQVERLLETTPDGMDKLYDRMLDVVATLHMPEDMNLARILLSWAMYSRTPLTVDELSEPYATEFRSVMDLKHTVNQICGQFVTINTSNQVTLVHHSAREYLRRHARQPFSLELHRSHEELFGKCLMAICDKDLRGKIQMLRVPQFLRYAATSWAFHLENCPVQSDRVLNGLTRFFKGSFPLSWIQYMTMSGHLSDLPGVSRRLTNYVRKRRKTDAEKPPMLHRISDLSLIETWAIDIMKIPAKFGRNLSIDPSLIYKCIPSLSPSVSAIYQKFSSSPAATLSVTGIENEEWDDCIARVSGGSGKATRLAASSIYLAVAADVPRGLITLWDTILFREYKTFNINERVSYLGFNETGSLLACCGIRRTCVWKVKDGSLALEAKNPRQERAVEFKFTGTDSLMMVTDLKRVYILPTKTDNAKPSQWSRLDQNLMTETSLPEGVWLGTPTSVAFNHDCSQMAVAYRNFPLTVWSVDPPCVVARMKRRHNSAQGSQNSYTGGNKVVWHPSGGHILGIFGDIFKWSPSEDTYETVNGETGVIPHEIECTPNGLAFVTGDVEGSIKIYEISSMTMIYKLTSEDGISRICLSPDSTHFYDLRGSYCNVWEPNCLMRLADVSSERFNDASSMTDSFWSDTEDTHSTSISFPASESRADNKPGIMTIALQRSATQPLAYSTDDGSIEVYHPGYDKSYKIAKSMSGISIEHLAWSDAHDQLAFSEIHGAVVVKSVTTSADSQLGLELETIYDETKTPGNRGNTRQLLFDSTGKKLFVHGETQSQVISIFDSTVKAERTNAGLENTSWLRHPTQHDQLVCLTTTEAKIFDWNLRERYTVPFSATVSTDAGNPITHAILPSYHTKLLLLRTVLVENNRRNYGFLILPTTVLSPTDPTNELHQALSMPKHLLEAISHPVGIIPDGRLVFLDKGLWVCTAQLNEQASITRHFFIPHDWVTSSGAQLCQVLPDGTFLCPTKGRVAIIKSSMASEW
ncbi:putative GPI inositol-deacylase [Seiridium unicorne]|uniref:GPI inositol-deacylase n=1 Tax=Seiridium unicorne TaxID=138068 RepID=A0ABR2UWA2_9PEZI